ncbi:hypothetical protein [Bradyrhizobium barranii]
MPNLPEVLPAGLEWLDVSHNQLSSLPENLPATLTRLIRKSAPEG